MQLSIAPFFLKKEGYIHSVNGELPIAKMGKCLIHENILVDFIGADKVTPERWDRAKVIQKVLPYLIEIKTLGYQTFFGCTPTF